LCFLNTEGAIVKCGLKPDIAHVFSYEKADPSPTPDRLTVVSHDHILSGSTVEPSRKKHLALMHSEAQHISVATDPHDDSVNEHNLGPIITPPG